MLTCGRLRLTITEIGRVFHPVSRKSLSIGDFELQPVPAKLDGTNEVQSIIVYAKAPPEGTRKQASYGQDVHEIIKTKPWRLIEVQPRSVILLGSVFIFSVLLGLAHAGIDRILFRKLRYYGLTMLAFLMMIGMIVYIASGLTFVNSVAKDGEALSLGFANIFRGRYRNDVDDEWIFSLTGDTRSASIGTKPAAPAPSPNETPTKDVHVSRGFGAPLWVILVSVIGGCLFTVSLLVKQVSETVDFTHQVSYQCRLEQILRHQFFLLFSPIAAIFVYQLLVAAEMVSNPVTVALAAFAAGVAMNGLMDKSVDLVQSFIRGSSTDPPPPPPGGGPPGGPPAGGNLPPAGTVTPGPIGGAAAPPPNQPNVSNLDF